MGPPPTPRREPGEKKRKKKKAGKKISQSDNVKILREVCKEISGRDLGVRFVITDTEAGNAAASDAPVSKEESERREQQLDKKRLREKAGKDPTVQQMLRTFRGEIVDVKRVDGKS